MASKPKKQGGRVTAKGTQPAVKKPRVAGPAGAKTPAADAATNTPAPGSPNRQMRRAGHNLEQTAPDTSRMRLTLIAGAVIATLLTVSCMVAFRLSGTWIGVLGLTAGVATGFAVATGKTFAAERGRMIAIGLVVFGTVVSVLGALNKVDFHWPFLALFGCGLGAFFAEMFVQQMTAPPGPPSSAVALLRRSGAQMIDVPSSGGSVWATPDGRVRVIIGAALEDGTTADNLMADKNLRKARQRAVLVRRRLAAIGAEEGIICVVDSAIPTVRDGDDLICSAAGLNKALNR